MIHLPAMKDSSHDDIRTALSSAKTIGLKEHEHASGRALLADHMHDHPAMAPWYVRILDVSSVGLFAARMSSFRTVATALVLVLMLGSGTSYAAEGALPGDILYPVKKVVNEGVRGALAVSPQAQVAWQTERASRRLAEAETLVQNNNLTQDKIAVIEQDLSDAAEHISSAHGDMATAFNAKARVATIAAPHGVDDAALTVATSAAHNSASSVDRHDSQDTDLARHVRSLEAISSSDSNTTTRDAVASIVAGVRSKFRYKENDDTEAVAASTASTTEGDSHGSNESDHRDSSRAGKGFIRTGAAARIGSDGEGRVRVMPALMNATATIPSIQIDGGDDSSHKGGQND